MKTLSVTEGRQNLGAWLKRALRGEDVGFVVDGRIVACSLKLLRAIL